MLGLYAIYLVIRLALGAYGVYQEYGDLKSLTTTSNAELPQALNNLRDHSGLAAAALADPLVRAASGLPSIGPWIRLADEGSASVSAIASNATMLYPLVDGRAGLVPDPKSIAGGIHTIFAQVHVLSAITAPIPSSGISHPKIVDSAIAELAKVDRNRAVLEKYAQFGAVLKQQSGTQSWLLATQNLAEARGTGGILGSFAVVRITAGKVRLAQVGSDSYLDSVGSVDHSSLPIDANAIWGMIDPADWRDLNASAHVPYAGQQLYDSWKKIFGVKLNGVIFLGQGITQNLVALAGSVSYDGHTLDSNSAADYLAKGIYADYPDPAKKNAFLAGFMRALFERLTSEPLAIDAFVNSLDNAKTGDELYVWSPDKSVESRIGSWNLSGAVPDTSGNYVLASDINGGGNKLEAYLHQRQVLTTCLATGVNVFTDSVSNLAPKSGLPAYTSPRLDLPIGANRHVGSNLDLISVYLPIGAEATDFSLDGQPIGAGDAYDRGHEILVFMVATNPGQTRTVSVTYRLKNSRSPSIETRASFNQISTRVRLTDCH
ncbi:MAG: DUF4012 domain-containing protein [Micrococcales bacterium]